MVDIEVYAPQDMGFMHGTEGVGEDDTRENITMKPGESRKVGFKIKAGENALEGGHIFDIIVREGPHIAKDTALISVVGWR